MGAVNPTKPRGASSHLNYMRGPSYDLANPVERLRYAAASCFFGEPQYYVAATSEEPDKRTPSWRRGSAHSELSRLSASDIEHLNEMLGSLDPQEWRNLGAKERMERIIDAALDADANATLEVALMLRNEDHIRTTPQVIMVRAANHPKVKGTQLIGIYAPRILKRADEPAVQLAYQLAAFGKPIPNALKRAWRRYLGALGPYQLAKYRMESRAVKTVDVVNVCHPTARKGSAIDKLVRGELKAEHTWEHTISTKGSTEENWSEAFGDMGHMALLRNLRNLVSKSSVSQPEIASKLVAGAKDGQQLPFRYWSAYKGLEGLGRDVRPVLIEAIEDCLVESCRQLALPGLTMSLCDNSGSAWGAMTSEWGTTAVAEIANLTAVLTAMGSEGGEVGVFGDKLETFIVNRKQSIFDLVKRANTLGQTVGGGTEHGIWLFWDKAIKAKQHYDAVFIYSDMQAGHGGLYGHGGYKDYVWRDREHRYGVSAYIDVPKLIRDYRKAVNPNVEVFLVQVAGYADTIVPEQYVHTHILGGWSEGILRYAQKMLTPVDSQAPAQ